jgi:hypothetical protein
MPGPEYEPLVLRQAREIEIEHGRHFYIVDTILNLRREKVGKPINARVLSDRKRRVWLAGVVLPVSDEQNMHGVLLGNNRLFFVGAQPYPQAEEEYKAFMSDPTPDSFDLPAPYDLDHIEKLFKNNLTSFPVMYLDGGEADEQSADLEWAIDFARDVKHKTKK